MRPLESPAVFYNQNSALERKQYTEYGLYIRSLTPMV